MPYTKSITAAFYGLLAKPYGTPDLSTGSALAVAHDTSPFVTAYPWVDQVGFGTKFANPATLPAGVRCGGVCFSPSGDTIFLCNSAGSFVTAYPFSSSGFGTKYADPATGANGEGTGIAIRSLPSSANHHIAVSDNFGAAAVFVNAWRFSKSGGGWGTKFTDPVTKPTGTATGVNFAPNGLDVAFSHGTSPFVTTYPWSDAGFGTKRANPATLPESTCNGVAFSKLGTTIAVAHVGVVNNITAYPWASGFGAKYADPLYPAGYFPMGGESIAFKTNVVVLGHNFAAGNTNAYVAWRWTDGVGFGTRYSADGDLNVGGQGSGPGWNEAGSTFFGSVVPAPRIKAFKWNDATGFNTAPPYANPAIFPTGTGNAMAIAP